MNQLIQRGDPIVNVPMYYEVKTNIPRDHLWSKSGIICGSGSFAVGDHLRCCTDTVWRRGGGQ